MTSDAIAKSDAADAPQFLSLTCHFDAKSTTSTSLLEMGLAGVQEAIAAMFLAPDQANDTWRVVLTREDLDPDKPRIIDAGDNRLVLKPVEGN